jgi:hypothetical protein
MQATEAAQFAVVLLLPLSYVGFLLWTLGRQHGRSRREIVTALAGVAACVAGIVAVALALNASRGGALFDLSRGSGALPGLRAGEFRPIDAAGIAVCVALLLAAVKVAKGVTQPRMPPASPPDEVHDTPQEP